MTYTDARRVLYHMTGRHVACRKPFRGEHVYEAEGEIHGCRVWFYVFLHARSHVNIHITILPCRSSAQVLNSSVWYWGLWSVARGGVECVDEQKFLARALHRLLP